MQQFTRFFASDSVLRHVYRRHSFEYTCTVPPVDVPRY